LNPVTPQRAALRLQLGNSLPWSAEREGYPIVFSSWWAGRRHQGEGADGLPPIPTPLGGHEGQNRYLLRSERVPADGHFPTQELSALALHFGHLCGAISPSTKPY